MSLHRAITAALLALVLGACAKSEPPLPNKNTNWLDQCESDSDCGEALECRCGVCTVTCESDSACELDARSAVCWQEQGDALEGRCAEPSSTVAICVPTELVDSDEPTEEDAPVEDCSEPGSCLTKIAEGLRLLSAIAVDDERVYWLEGSSSDPATFESRKDGAFKSVRHDGSALVTLAADIDPLSNLQIDATHAYFTHSVQSTALSRIPLAGGEAQHIYEMSTRMGGLVLTGPLVYFMGEDGRTRDNWPMWSVFAVPVDGSLYINPLYVPERAEAIVADLSDMSPFTVVDKTLYWNDGQAIKRFDMEADTGTVELAPSNNELGDYTDLAGEVVHHDGYLFWPWSDDGEAAGFASLELANPDNFERITVPGIDPWAGIAVDATHVYWHQVDFESGLMSIVRSDRTTHDTRRLVSFDGVDRVMIVLSDEQVFVAGAIYGSYEADEPGRGFIARFPK